MNNDKSIERIIESIRVIEKQIDFFRNNKPFFWQCDKIKQYNYRIQKLEASREYLCKMLEFKISNR